jgi:hypothetical protein
MPASPANLGNVIDLEEKYEEQFSLVSEGIKHLMAPPEQKRHKVGFCPE